MAKPLYIFDLDGTLADCRHRLHLIPHDWPAFHATCIYDKPIMPNICTLLTLYTAKCEVWIVSGRNESARKQTMLWLRTHTGIDFQHHHVMMRPEGDYRPDDEVKQDVLDNMLHEDRQRLVAVFDDRDRVVSMWRRNKVTCFQVAPGDF
jgi:hypothetical protein